METSAGKKEKANFEKLYILYKNGRGDIGKEGDSFLYPGEMIKNIVKSSVYLGLFMEAQSF